MPTVPLSIHLNWQQSNVHHKQQPIKATLIKGNCVADLTGGLGIDTLAFAKRASKVDYYERYNEYCSAANHNFKTLGHNNITVHNCDFREELAQIKADTIYIDPDRSGNNAQRVFSYTSMNQM